MNAPATAATPKIATVYQSLSRSAYANARNALPSCYLPDSDELANAVFWQVRAAAESAVARRHLSP